MPIAQHVTSLVVESCSLSSSAQLQKPDSPCTLHLSVAQHAVSTSAVSHFEVVSYFLCMQHPSLSTQDRKPNICRPVQHTPLQPARQGTLQRLLLQQQDHHLHLPLSSGRLGRLAAGSKSNLWLTPARPHHSFTKPLKLQACGLPSHVKGLVRPAHDTCSNCPYTPWTTPAGHRPHTVALQQLQPAGQLQPALRRPAKPATLQAAIHSSQCAPDLSCAVLSCKGNSSKHTLYVCNKTCMQMRMPTYHLLA